MKNNNYFRMMCLCLVLALGGAGSGWAQVAPSQKGAGPEVPSPGVSRERDALQLEAGRETPDSFFRGKFSVSAEWYLDFISGQFTPSWRKIHAGGDFVTLTMPVRFNYWVTDKFQTTLRVPLVVNWASNVHSQGPKGERNAAFGGVGDISLIFKHTLLEEDTTCPMVAGYFSVDFPTGHYRHLNPGRLDTDLLGDGSYNFILGFNLAKEIKPFLFMSNLWYAMATSSFRDLSDGRTVVFHFRDKVIFNFGAEYFFTEKFGLLTLIYSQWDAGRIFGPKGNIPPAALVGILPELDYTPNRHWNFSLGVAIDLAGKNTTFAYTPTLFAKYFY